MLWLNKQNTLLLYAWDLLSTRGQCFTANNEKPHEIGRPYHFFFLSKTFAFNLLFHACIYSTYHVLETILNTVHVLIQLFFTQTKKNVRNFSILQMKKLRHKEVRSANKWQAYPQVVCLWRPHTSFQQDVIAMVIL